MGLHVPLDVNYSDDLKMIEAGEKAELLYIRALCMAKRMLSDGFIADNQLKRLGLSGHKQRAQRLVDTGLWLRVDGGFQIAAWLKHNKSAEEIAALSEKRADAGKMGGRPRRKQNAFESESKLLSTGESNPKTHSEVKRSESEVKSASSDTADDDGEIEETCRRVRHSIADEFLDVDLDAAINKLRKALRAGEVRQSPSGWARKVASDERQKRQAAERAASPLVFCESCRCAHRENEDHVCEGAA